MERNGLSQFSCLKCKILQLCWYTRACTPPIAPLALRHRRDSWRAGPLPDESSFYMCKVLRFRRSELRQLDNRTDRRRGANPFRANHLCNMQRSRFQTRITVDFVQ